MSLLLHLLLSHFIADFPLQSKKIVEIKHKNFFGILLHTFIHLVVMAVIMYPVLNIKKVWISVLIVFVVHTIVDTIKVYIDNKYPDSHRLFWYMTDQFAHWLTVILVSCFYISKLSISFPTNYMSLYYNQSVIIYLLLAVITTYFYDITRWFYRASKGVKKPIIPYKRDYKMIITNLIVVSVGFGVYWGYLYLIN